MDFYSELEARGLQDVLVVTEYEPPALVGWEKLKGFLLDIVQNKRSVYLEGDYDVDGLMSALVTKSALTDLGVGDLTVYNYRDRMHNIDQVAVQQCIQGHYDYFIVVDAGSNDIGLLRRLTTCGIKVIVLDHHVTELKYSDFGDDIAVVNTEIENACGADLKLSAGALCFVVFDLLYRELEKKSPAGLASYAAVSLLADVMDMSNALNRSIYFLGTQIDESRVPTQLLYFKGDYSRFNARYIGYWFSPRINACFRAEQFVFLNELYFGSADAAVKSKCIQMIEQIYVESRKLVQSVSDVLDAYTVKMDNFVLADLASVSKYFDIQGNKLYNYTGYIANGLADKSKKTAIVVCEVDNILRGSLRDLYSRDYLSIFKHLCYAAGHSSAFGIRIRKLDYSTFLDDLKRVDDLYAIQTIQNEPIIVDEEYVDSSVIEDMARYNEVAGAGIPIAMFRKQFVGEIVQQRSNYGYRYKWGGYVIQSDHKVVFGRSVLIKPFFSLKLKLQVQ